MKFGLFYLPTYLPDHSQCKVSNPAAPAGQSSLYRPKCEGPSKPYQDDHKLRKNEAVVIVADLAAFCTTLTSENLVTCAI
jgi:hypothetical protein